MAEDNFVRVADLKPLIDAQTRLILEAQAAVLALLAYLRTDPAFDEARFAALHDEQRRGLNLPELIEPDASSALIALLKRFEGPTH